MGVYISKTAYSPLSLTSTCIGFVSFVFTLGTFFKVVWVNLSTLNEDPHEVHGYLTNLRTELLEEKANIKMMRKESKHWHRVMRREGRDYLLGIELDDVSLKTMGDQVRSLIKQFKALERPFLATGSEGIGDWKEHRNRRRRDSSASPYEHSAYASPPEKNHDDGKQRGRKMTEDEGDMFWAQRTQYAKYTFGRRMIWLRKKAKAQTMYETLTRVQTRRIARQVGGLCVLVHQYGDKALQDSELIHRIDERTQRIVGVRRVD